MPLLSQAARINPLLLLGNSPQTRCRLLDPVTGKIYHQKYSPPETKEIAARLTQRFDDSEEKVKLRLVTRNTNMEDVLSLYGDVTFMVDGGLPKH